MLVVVIEKTTEWFFTCPKCGKKYDQLFEIDDQLKCSNCNTVFFDGKDVPAEAWKEEPIDAIRCERCNRLVAIKDSNYSISRDYPALLCTCLEGGDPHFHQQHTLAIRFEEKWQRPEDFLTDGKRNGIAEASSPRQRMTLRVLSNQAKLDDHRFRSIDNSIPAKIYWKDGKAIGYYSYTVPPVTKRPVLHQLFVWEDERRKGFATAMVSDFLASHADDELGIEDPNHDFLKVLLKMGEVELKGADYHFVHRLRYPPPRM